MGGVDLADMRRLHCNSTIMGQHRWWLKLFFYLLDVGTSNSLVLYREATDDKINISQFKSRLVKVLVGPKLVAPILDNIPAAHELILSGHRNQCVYCALTLDKNKIPRSRFKCCIATCNLPLCSIGNGKVGDDCFAKAHASKEIHKACIEKYKSMQIRTNNKGK